MSEQKSINWKQNYELAKEYMKEFVKTRMFLKYAIVAISVPVIFFTVLGFFLDWYTHHDTFKEVPNFRGLSLDKAADLADESDVNFKVIDSVYNFPEAASGTVVEQSPPPKFKVKVNRTIFLTIKRYSIEKIKMPYFVGISITQAKSELLTYGFKLGNIQNKPGFNNLVLEQKFKGKEIKDGEIIERGSVIDLTVGLSQGEGDDPESATGDATVPELSGLTQKQAESTLLSSSLSIGKSVFDASVRTKKDSLAAKVFKQTPASEAQTAAGETVNIWLTVNKTKLQLLELTKKN